MPDTVAYYLSKGFDRKTAVYFASGRRTIVSVAANDDFSLTLTFDNGEVRIYDASPLLKPGTVFAPFADIDAFRRVYLDDTHCVSWDINPDVDSSVVWSNKVDLSSDTCYLDSIPAGGAAHV